MDIPVPEAALDAAEKEWHDRIARGQIEEPREHIRGLLIAAMPHLVIVRGEVVPEQVQGSSADNNS